MEDAEIAHLPTDVQQKIITLLILPSSILSIIGSVLIICHVRQENKKNMSPYKSIMCGQSAFDIVSSVGWMMQPFLLPANSSEAWVWSFGNHTTCSVSGAITQMGIAAHLYTSLLSFYFLLTARFGMTQLRFSKMLPCLHGFIILWTLVTCSVGLAMDLFTTLGTSPFCWIGTDGFSDSGTRVLIAYIFGGIPSILTLMVVFVNNLILYCHVRRTVAEGQRKALEAERKLTSYIASRASQDGASQDGPSGDFSLGGMSNFMDGSLRQHHKPTPHTGQQRSVLRSSDKQWQRVQQVGYQSLRYVMAYFSSYFWVNILNILDSRDYEYTDNAARIFLPLLIFQSILLPAFGAFNALIYFRPMYLRIKKQNPLETRMWCIRSAVFGSSSSNNRTNGSTPNRSRSTDTV